MLRVLAGDGVLSAAIMDFRGSIYESLQRFPQKCPPAYSDSGFEWVNLGIAAGIL